MLEGLRALDLTTGDYAACGRILASLGVEVIHAGRERERSENLAGWRARHYGKRCIDLDVESAAGRTQVAELASQVDFFIESFAPGFLAAHGLGYAELAKANPRLVYVSITPFGQSGPYASYLGDELIASAMSGVLITLGDPDRPPVAEALDANGFHACSGAALGALLAYYERVRSGRGQRVDQSVQEAGVSRNTNNLLLYQFDKRCITRGGSYLRFGKASIRCVWRLRDGYAFHSMATGRFGAPANRALIGWMDELGVEHPMRDIDWERYDRSALDPAVRLTWEAAMAGFFADRTKREIAEEGRRRGINAAVANEPADLLTDPQLAARGYFGPLVWPEDGRNVMAPKYFVRTDGESAARAPTNGSSSAGGSPLQGIRVLDFSWALVGALTTKQLGDFGADIVKVESAGRMCLTRIDNQVSVSKPGNPNDKPWFAHLNTSKRGIALDLKHPQVAAVLDRLIAWADVVVENFSPGTMDKLGLGYAQLKAKRPGIIMVSGSVYGQTGPLAQEWGVDGTGAALSGRLYLTGWPDRDPVIPSVPYGDALLPLLMASATVAALDRRRRTGEGAHIDASMFEVQAQQLWPALLESQVSGVRPQRAANRVCGAAPHGAFPCRGEDRWIAISVSDESQWRALAGHVRELAGDSRFATLALRKANEPALEERLAQWTAKQDAYELMHTLQRIGVPAGVVQTAEDLLERDPQLRARQFLVDAGHPVLGVFGHQAPPYKLSRTPANVRRAPLLGEHTREVCVGDLGMSEEEFRALDAAGAFK